ncbi:hypothetical protein [Peribacillus simplex]|uniref:hypothetical protein n=1 Tax=Peribacillus simplex TaxID=1478 RepID=UPI0016245C70|nr:hypothetical protein [Peribacillus simplex]
MSSIKLLQLKIDVLTTEKRFGKTINFIDRLNIIRAENTKGKSSVINSILYVLGMEELLEGKNAKTMKPALKESIKINNETEMEVIESKVHLKIMNNNEEKIEIIRWVKCKEKDERLIQVNFLDEPSRAAEDYYIHLSGSASAERGFHRFFIDFLNIDLPLVATYSENEVPLYLQTIFPYFFIEQKKGWQGFYSSVSGGFNIRDVSKRAFEYLLNMDILKNQKKKEELNLKKTSINNKWSNIIKSIENLSDKAKGLIDNLPRTPQESFEVKFYIYDKNQEAIQIQDKIKDLNEKISKFSFTEVQSIGEVNEKHEAELRKYELELLVLQGEVDVARKELALEKKNFFDMNETKTSLESDLKNNIEANKLYKLGANVFGENISKTCPVCSQHFEDSLTSNGDILTLSLSDNISFIKEQISTLKFGIEQTRILIMNKERKVAKVAEVVAAYRKNIQLIKSELSANPKLLSQRELEKLVEMKFLHKVLLQIYEEYEGYKKELDLVNEDWKKYLSDKASLPKEYFSELDKDKLKCFEKSFKRLLIRVGFSSVDVNQITISLDKYVPQVDGFDIKFDASASDNIRVIWSYAIAIALTSLKFEGNHPGFIVFDEPGQQQMSFESQKELFNLLMSNNLQSIIGTSVDSIDIQKFFKDKDSDLAKINEFNKSYVLEPLIEK